jgi:hypothetical protein
MALAEIKRNKRFRMGVRTCRQLFENDQPLAHQEHGTNRNVRAEREFSGSLQIASK